MPMLLVLISVLALLVSPLGASAKDARVTLDDVAKALGASTLKSIQYTGAGGAYAVGQSPAPGLPWPQFNAKSYTRSVNYETPSLRDEQVRYLPKEKLLSQADAFTPLPPNTAPPTPVSPFTVNLADNITRLALAVDGLVPLHGRLVPLAELNRTIGRAP